MGQPGISEIDIARIEQALEDVAVLLEDDLVYLPIFERLEEDLAAARAKQDARSRAREIRKARASRNAAPTPDDPEP
ncbi:hypothetical protein [Palleronia abyssalis]|uniref:Uncharacterized protein n=1 Tax=Palleronia abyssalis TaxID=1501240 RepID=A0A2R8C0K9_9RHOB|nr:hypothetical protein [Palleronia abyssalis]SPJ25938.1 hypothetical protein PAA8504_03794 [Palleronia abyssalis]